MSMDHRHMCQEICTVLKNQGLGGEQESKNEHVSPRRRERRERHQGACVASRSRGRREVELVTAPLESPEMTEISPGPTAEFH